MNVKQYDKKINKYQNKISQLVNNNIRYLDDDPVSNFVPESITNNNLLTKLYNEREIFENLATLFIDKIMPTAVSHANLDINNMHPNIKILICGGKALNFYTHIHEQNKYIKSFDYDLCILGDDNNEVSDNYIGNAITFKANEIYNKNIGLMNTIYNNTIYEINKLSNSIHYLDIDEITNNGIKLDQLFVHNKYGTSLFGRTQESCYIVIFYKFKNFSSLTSNKNLHHVDSINISDVDLINNAEKVYNGIVRKNIVYYTGFGITDTHHEKYFPYFASIPTSNFKIGNNYVTTLIRKYTDHYNVRTDYVNVYLPHFDLVVMNLFYLAHLNRYQKKNRNLNKLNQILEHMHSPLEKLNVTLFTESAKQRTFYLNYQINKYTKIIQKGIDTNTITTDFPNLNKYLFALARLYETLASVPFNKLLNTLPIINGNPDNNLDYCDSMNYDHVRSLILYQNKLYNRIKNKPNLDHTNNILLRYVFSSIDINLSLILGKTNNVVPYFSPGTTVGEYTKILNDTIIKTHQLSFGAAPEAFDKYFYVYNVSKVYNKNIRNSNQYDNSESTYFKVGEKYVLPSFMSTSYNKCLKNIAGFIGYEFQPFVFRIMIPVNFTGFMCLGYEQEIIIQPYTTLRIVDINRSYAKLNKDLYVTCLLIDCTIDESDGNIFSKYSNQHNNLYIKPNNQSNSNNEDENFYSFANNNQSNSNKENEIFHSFANNNNELIKNNFGSSNDYINNSSLNNESDQNNLNTNYKDEKFYDFPNNNSELNGGGNYESSVVADLNKFKYNDNYSKNNLINRKSNNNFDYLKDYPIISKPNNNFDYLKDYLIDNRVKISTSKYNMLPIIKNQKNIILPCNLSSDDIAKILQEYYSH